MFWVEWVVWVGKVIVIAAGCGSTVRCRCTIRHAMLPPRQRRSATSQTLAVLTNKSMKNPIFSPNTHTSAATSSHPKVKSERPFGQEVVGGEIRPGLFGCTSLYTYKNTYIMYGRAGRAGRRENFAAGRSREQRCDAQPRRVHTYVLQAQSKITR